MSNRQHEPNGHSRIWTLVYGARRQPLSLSPNQTPATPQRPGFFLSVETQLKADKGERSNVPTGDRRSRHGAASDHRIRVQKGARCHATRRLLEIFAVMTTVFDAVCLDLRLTDGNSQHVRWRDTYYSTERLLRSRIVKKVTVGRPPTPKAIAILVEAAPSRGAASFVAGARGTRLPFLGDANAKIEGHGGTPIDEKRMFVLWRAPSSSSAKR
jgi:hypothetical protein